jgi:hypothetical protein
MSTTMLLKKKLTRALNSYIAKKIKTTEELLSLQKSEMESNFEWGFEANIKQVYQCHTLLAHLKSIEGKNVGDPIEYLDIKIDSLSNSHIVKSGISTTSSILSTLSSAWRQEIQFIFINILKECKEKLELVRDGKVCVDIPVNLWDDYDEEDPKGTYMYIEDGGNTSIEFKEKCLKHLVGVMNNDMRIMGASYQDGVYEGDPYIRIKNISYENLEKLTKELQGMNLEYEGIPFRFYSES